MNQLESSGAESSWCSDVGSSVEVCLSLLRKKIPNPNGIVNKDKTDAAINILAELVTACMISPANMIASRAAPIVPMTMVVHISVENAENKNEAP